MGPERNDRTYLESFGGNHVAAIISDTDTAPAIEAESSEVDNR